MSKTRKPFRSQSHRVFCWVAFMFQETWIFCNYCISSQPIRLLRIRSAAAKEKACMPCRSRSPSVDKVSEKTDSRNFSFELQITKNEVTDETDWCRGRVESQRELSGDCQWYASYPSVARLSGREHLQEYFSCFLSTMTFRFERLPRVVAMSATFGHKKKYFSWFFILAVVKSSKRIKLLLVLTFSALKLILLNETFAKFSGT